MFKKLVAIAAILFAVWSSYEGFVVVQSAKIAIASHQRAID